MPQYSEIVDPHIYVTNSTICKPSDWIDIAMAALDQAGLSLAEQNQVRHLLDDMMFSRPEVRPYKTVMYKLEN